MKYSRQLMEEANIIPRLRLGTQNTGGGVTPNGPHRIKILQDKLTPVRDYKTGREVMGVRYLVEENGETKVYERKKINDKGYLDYLVQKLAEVPEGAEVVLEMKKRGIRSYIDLMIVRHVDRAELNEDDEIDATDADPSFGREDDIHTEFPDDVPTV